MYNVDMASIDEEIKQYTCIIDLTLNPPNNTKSGFFSSSKTPHSKSSQSYGLIKLLGYYVCMVFDCFVSYLSFLP